MEIPAQTDVLVIGGGPAGTCAATELAHCGYSVMLVDKVRHPREVVGESILPHAWRYFDRLGATQLIEREGFVKKAGGVVAWEGQISEISFRDFDFDRPGLHVERAALDHLLLKNARAAGVQVFEGVIAQRFVEDQGEGAQVWLFDTGSKQRHRVTCRFFVDASGQGAFVGRQLGTIRFDPDFRFITLWGYFTGSRYVGAGGIIRPFENISKHPPVTFVCSLGNWGWAWHIPLRKNTSVGILVPIEDYKKRAEAARSRNQYFLDICMSNPHLAALLDGAQLSDGDVRVMRDFSYASGTVAGPGYFVIGDAAGFVDPIFSIGVVVALYAGELAAWAIDSSLRHPEKKFEYRSLFATQLAGRVQLYRTVALPTKDRAIPASDAAKVYFNFIPEGEKQLMWSAASMTMRSGNLLRAGGPNWVPPSLKRHDLQALRVQ